MTAATRPWDAGLVRNWLVRRLEASRLDQAAADRRGYGARDDYDKAAAEEWVCRALRNPDVMTGQAVLAARLKELIGLNDYPAAGLHDDVRFKRLVRAYLRQHARMTKANQGFENILHHQ